MYVDNLIIEITRKCNLSCWFCLRGDSQDKVISKETVDMIFDKITEVNILTITGGEPSLALEQLNYIIYVIEKKNINVHSFYIATNGVMDNKKANNFLLSLIRLYALCNDKEITQLKVSNHTDEADRNEIFKVLKFADYEDKKYNADNILSEGRAEGYSQREVRIYPLENEDGCIMGEFYVNVNGDIFSCCDLSYNSQEEKKGYICNIKDFTVDTIKEATNND